MRSNSDAAFKKCAVIQKLVQPELRQLRQQFTDLAVHARDHRRLALERIGPVLRRVEAVVGHLRSVAESPGPLVVGVRHGERQVEEERPVPVALDEGAQTVELA